MPARPDTEELQYPLPPSEWPYISKSRLTAFVKNPRHAYYRYVEGLREPENFWMKRGSRIHEAFERYYENVSELESLPRKRDLPGLMPDDVMLWADFTEPFISNFLVWEGRRLEASNTITEFAPVGIEEEVWLDDPPVADSPPWMGFADVILDANSVPGVDDEGVVVLDFKTGKTPKPEYRDEGIFLEGEYYAMLFEDVYDVAAVAGYYPKNDDLVVSPLSDERRSYIIETIEEMVSLGTEMEDWQTNPGPLCKWAEGKENESSFYRICDCDWGKPGGPGPTYE